MDAVLFQPSDLYIRKHDINMCDAFYHEESRCWLFWTLDSTFYVYLRDIQMDSFCPEPRLDHVQVFGYFLCGVSGTTIYMYDWSTWALVYSHDYKQSILKFGLVHNDIYVLTNDNVLYKASKVEQKNIQDLLCVSTQVFYHTSSRLCTPEMSVDAKYILSLFNDDEYIYALRNRKRVDYWEHTLAHRQTIHIPSNIPIQKIQRVESFFILQTLNDIYILNDEGILLYHKTYEETTWLVLCNGYLCVSSDDATRIYDFKRACTCFQLQNNDIVQLEKIYACYARIMASNVDRWFYRASIRVGILCQHKPLFRLYLDEHCRFVTDTGDLKHIKRILDECPNHSFCHQHLYRYCTNMCKHTESFREHLVTLLVFLFEQMPYHPNRPIWTYCCRYASSCYYWFSLVLSHPKSHLLIKNMFRYNTIRSVLTCIQQEKVQQMCEYGLLPFWIRVCHEYHTNHCYAFQPKIALFRKWMIDMILKGSYEVYGTWRKAGYHDLTPLLTGSRIRTHGIEGIVKRCVIRTDRSREWSWDNDHCLLPSVEKDMVFEIFEPVKGYPKNTLEAALHMLDTERFWQFQGGWQSHDMCDCMLHNKIRNKITKKQSVVLKHTPTHLVLIDDIIDKLYVEREYQVYKKPVKYQNSFIQNTKLLHFVLDMVKNQNDVELSKEYKDSLFSVMRDYSDINIEYTREPVSCLFLNRFGDKLFIADPNHLIRDDKMLISHHDDVVSDMISLGSTFVSGSIDGVVKVNDVSSTQCIHVVKGSMRIRWYRKRLIWILHDDSFIAEYSLDTFTLVRTFEPLRVSRVCGFEIVNECAYICTPEKVIQIDGNGYLTTLLVPNVVWSCMGFENFFHVLLGTTKGHMYKVVDNQCVPLELKHKRELTHVGSIHGLVVAIDEEQITLYHKGEVFMSMELFPEKVVRFQYDIYGRCIVAFQNRYMTIYWDYTVRLKCADVLMKLLQRDTFSSYIHEYQSDYMIKVVSELEPEDVLHVIYVSTREYDHRRMWCKPWVFNLCMNDQGSLANSILKRLVYYTGARFDNCSICFSVVGNTNVMRLKCGHLFHQTCIDQYFDSLPSYKEDMLHEYALQVDAKCPNCRAPCKRQDIIKDEFWTTQNTSI